MTGAARNAVPARVISRRWIESAAAGVFGLRHFFREGKYGMKIRKRILFCAVFAVISGFIAGCSTAAKNVENSKQLRVGMTKSEVLEVMGEPLSGESFCKPDLWFYYYKNVWADGLTTEDECMPLVFENGRLAGWGNRFYASYRINKKDGHGGGNQDLEIPAE